jgi:hypothetical protein
MRCQYLLVALTVAVTVACNTTTPTSPTTTTATTTTATTTTTAATTATPTPVDGFTPITFDLTVPPGGVSFYSFTISTAGAAIVDLASVQTTARGPATPTVLRLGVGVPRGEGCAVTQSVDVGPALTSQLKALLPVGIFCISVADTGALTAPVLATVRFIHS